MFLSYLYGVISYKYELFPFYQIKHVLNLTLDKVLYKYTGNNITFNKTQVNCDELKENTLSIIVLGQSNAANSGIKKLNEINNVYNYNILDDKCYLASDPLLGTTGSGAAIWTILGRDIINGYLAQRVLITPIAVSGSSIEQWQPDKHLFYPRIEMAFNQLEVKGITSHFVFWQQGESDQNMTSNEYFEKLNTLIQRINTLSSNKIKFFIADSSYCHKTYSNNIRAANRQTIKNMNNVFSGPDIDQYQGALYRYDDCHLSTLGQNIAAKEWLNDIKPQIKQLFKHE